MNRLYTLLVSATMCAAGAVHAQNVGINTTGAVPNASAGLDVDFSNKGMLIPRVGLTSRLDNTTIASPATSLLVYNTATAGAGVNAVTPGYYYWNSASWVRLALDGDAWKTNGNAGTTASTAAVDAPATDNFLGTTDNQALVLVTNNFQRMKIMPDNATQTRIGIGTAFPTVYPAIPGRTPSLLHIYDGGTGVEDISVLQIGSNQSVIGRKVGELNFHSSVNGADRRTAFIESFITDVSGVLQSGDLRFSTNLVGTVGERMRLTAQGRLGIGTTTPGQGLHVSFPTGADAAVRIQNTGATGNAWDIQSTNAGHLHFNQMSAAVPFNALHLNGANGFVGINNGTPTQRLSVIGNFRLDGAFMPGNNAGAANQLLMSAGPGNSPTWGPTIENAAAINGIGKFYSGLFNINNNTYLTLTVADPDMTVGTAVSFSLNGNLPAAAGLFWGYNFTVIAEARNGSVIFHITNVSGYNLSNLEITYSALY